MKFNDSRGVSPVIAVTLLVLIVVVLSSLTFVSVALLSNTGDDPATAGASTNYVSEYEKSVQIVSKTGNVEGRVIIESSLGTEYKVRDAGDTQLLLSADTGRKATVQVNNRVVQEITTDGFNPDITVDKHGTEDFTSIQTAVNNANSGDIIVVERATYKENIDINKDVTLIAEKGTVIKDADPERAVIDIRADGVQVGNFIVNADPQQGDGHYSKHGVYVDSNSVTLSALKIKNAKKKPSSSAIYIAGDSTTILNSQVSKSNVGITASNGNNNVFKTRFEISVGTHATHKNAGNGKLNLYATNVAPGKVNGNVKQAGIPAYSDVLTFNEPPVPGGNNGGGGGVGGTVSNPHATSPNCGSVTFSGSGTQSDPYKVPDDWHLQCIGHPDTTTTMSDVYKLTQNIDASKTSQWNSGSGFVPLHNRNTGDGFTGTFLGNGKYIKGLAINRPARNAGTGLFQETTGSVVVKNVELRKPDITATTYVGAVTGKVSTGPGGKATFKSITISQGSVTGKYSGRVGGVIGFSEHKAVIKNVQADTTVSGSGTSVGGILGETSGNVKIVNSESHGTVTGQGRVGGLVGAYYDGSKVGKNIYKSHATGTVVISSTYLPNANAGGLVGTADGSEISIRKSYATGDVNAGTKSNRNRVGGLVGHHTGTYKMVISESYATGSVTGNNKVGGLVGHTEGDIRNSFATGSVSGTDWVGGLVGQGDAKSSADAGNAVERTYATGTVSGSTHVGGLIGGISGSSGEYFTVTKSYWDTTTTGQSTGVGTIGPGTIESSVQGLTTSEMQGSSAQSNMAFDFSTIWETMSGDYPRLRAI